MNNFEEGMKWKKRMNSSSLAIKICSYTVGRMRDEFQFELFYEKLIKMNHLFTHGCISTYPPFFNILFSFGSLLKEFDLVVFGYDVGKLWLAIFFLQCQIFLILLGIEASVDLYSMGIHSAWQREHDVELYITQGLELA